MNFMVADLLDGKPQPVTIPLQAEAGDALNLMLEHGFDQLPVLDDQRVVGLVSYTSLVQASLHLGCPVGALRVRDALIRVEPISREADRSELITRLAIAPATLVLDRTGALEGILTLTDLMAHLSRFANDWLLLREIETTLREIVADSFKDERGEVAQVELEEAIARSVTEDKVSTFRKTLNTYLKEQDPARKVDAESARRAWNAHYGRKEAQHKVDGLEFGDCIKLFADESRWNANFTPGFGEDRKRPLAILDRVRRLRNQVAHFRDELKVEDQRLLVFCSGWLSRCRDALVVPVPPMETTVPDVEPIEMPPAEPSAQTSPPVAPEDDLSPADRSVYAPLSLFLESQPSDVRSLSLTFADVARILGRELPASAVQHRAWWGNDQALRGQARAWLEVGWRVSGLNVTEGKVTFTRIVERERANIQFFSEILGALREREPGHLWYGSPHGGTFHWFSAFLVQGETVGWLGVSFARGGRLRVEFYLDTRDQLRNKVLFDQLHSRHAEIEANLGETLSWERLDNKRACRIAVYRQLGDSDADQVVTRAWAVETLLRLYPVMEKQLERVRDAKGDTTGEAAIIERDAP